MAKLFWDEFLRKPDEAQKHPAFSARLWEGVPGEVRGRVWSHFGMTVEGSLRAADRKDLVRSVKEDLVASVMSELESCVIAGVSTALQDIDVEAVQRLVLEHHRRLQLEVYAQGTAQLAATILTVTKNERATAGLLAHYHTRLQPYRADDRKLLLNDLLVLSDVMMQLLPDLCEHMNKGGFDAVDLSDIVGSWCLALFASYFPSYTVLRTLDLMLFETHECVLAVAFGIMKAMKGVLLLSAGEDIFTALTNIPHIMEDSEVDLAFKFAHEMIQNEHKRMALLRKDKDWARCLEHAGPLRFYDGVGNPAAPVPSQPDPFESKRSPLPRGTSQKVLVSKETKTEGDDDDGQEKDMPEIIFGLEKMRGKIADPNISRLVEEASREIRRQHEAILTLQMDLKEQQTTAGSDVSSVASSDEDSGSDEDFTTPTGRHLESPHGRERKLPDGVVKHSKLFQYQQFPCLYMEGYLLKLRKRNRRPEEALAPGALHRRFFVLHGAYLTYFKSHRSPKPPHDLSVAMKGRDVKLLNPCPPKLGFGFVITDIGGRGELYVLVASTADELNVWMQVLAAAAESADM